MSVLDRIKTTLEGMLQDAEVPMETVGYGGVRKSEIDRWNYFVFNRLKRTKNNSSRQDLQTFFQVHVVHENYIPEGYIDRVIKTLEAPAEPGTKIRQTNDDIIFSYVYKGNTDLVVEIATITFYHPEKRC